MKRKALLNTRVQTATWIVSWILSVSRRQDALVEFVCAAFEARLLSSPPPVWFYLLEVKQNIRYALANLTQFCSNKRLERNNWGWSVLNLQIYVYVFYSGDIKVFRFCVPDKQLRSHLETPWSMSLSLKTTEQTNLFSIS